MKLKRLAKLFCLFEFFLLMNSFACKAYVNARLDQFDLNNDRVFSKEEASLAGYDIWSLRTYSDVGDNLRIIASPAIALVLALVTLGIGALLAGTKPFKRKAAAYTNHFFRKKDVMLAGVLFLVIAGAFFAIYLRSPLSAGSILQAHDYLILCAVCAALFFMTVLIDTLLEKLFRYGFLINVLWALCLAETFSSILYDTLTLKTDSFLYLLLPLASFVPVAEKVVRAILHNHPSSVLQM